MITSHEALVVAQNLTARLGPALVQRMDGSTVRMSELWQRAPTVNAFVRHFGCLFCHEMVHDLVQATSRIIETGARVVIVGNGTVDQARYFFEQKGLPLEGVDVVTDPERETYRAAGFERGYARTFLWPGTHGAFTRARAGGHRIKGVFGDLTQLGGVLVLAPPARVLYLHRSKFAGDHPDMGEVLRSLP